MKKNCEDYTRKFVFQFALNIIFLKLNSLSLTNFKNYKNLNISCDETIVCFVGQNGEGKTNLLDSIYYLCIGKSYFNSIERQSILHSEDFLRLEAEFTKEKKKDHLSIVSALGKKKQIKKNGVEYDRIAEHLGYAPVCFVAPDDTKLILGTSQERRRFMNASLSQIYPRYLSILSDYRRLVKQTNSFLKGDYVDKTLLDTYYEHMAPLGEEIYQFRKQYFEEFSSIVHDVYEQISQNKEQTQCKYKSHLHDEISFVNQLTDSKIRDIHSQRCTVGTHRDDLVFLIDGKPLKVYGSQGQQKTFLLALKFAELLMISKSMKVEPIFLLDDIFDKLDEHRVQELFQYLLDLNFGQLFITDTNGKRLKQLLSKFNRKFVLFSVQNQELIPYEK